MTVKICKVEIRENVERGGEMKLKQDVVILLRCL